MRNASPASSRPFTLLLSALAFFVAGACSARTSAPPAAPSHESRPQVVLSDAWKAYWYRGLAEITSYTLEQARYGEIHRGDAVLIFVTEDFSASKQVKLDRPETAPAGDRIPVLKLNLTKKFATGIYPYSLMTSVFSPVDGRPTLKVSTSGQEWCGHVYTQLNLSKEKGHPYHLRSFSYFESEVEEDRSLDGAWLEDELWSRLRLDPTTLPQGTFRVIPSTLFGRLHHHPLAIVTATAKLDETENATFGLGALRRYRVEFLSPSRAR